jgi:hypothetical protein
MRDNVTVFSNNALFDPQVAERLPMRCGGPNRMFKPSSPAMKSWVLSGPRRGSRRYLGQSPLGFQWACGASGLESTGMT